MAVVGFVVELKSSGLDLKKTSMEVCCFGTFLICFEKAFKDLHCLVAIMPWFYQTKLTHKSIF